VVVEEVVVIHLTTLLVVAVVPEDINFVQILKLMELELMQ
tara:strand:- start:463 stop:582 length:120 start_codon:yes stop_codon:yes gene_type:complete